MDRKASSGSDTEATGGFGATDSMLELRGVSKRYLRRHHGRQSLAAALHLPGAGRSRVEELWALRDIDLAVHRGETLGVIGANGAGKSTLLGLMAGTLRADRGSVHASATVAPLIDVSLGFQPELTGEENLYLSAALFGLSRKEITDRLEAIVDFAELGDVLDVPVRSYSTGMVARLGFALATHVGAGVLLIDEVLAVGDRAFRRKCLARIAELRRGGAAAVVVSHDLETIEATCDRACLIQDARLQDLGPVSEVVGRYRAGC